MIHVHDCAKTALENILKQTKDPEQKAIISAILEVCYATKR